MRRELSNRLQRFVAIARTGDHLEIVLEGEEMRKTVEYYRMIVGYNEADGHDCTCRL
jgi:hypothetical protein